MAAPQRRSAKAAPKAQRKSARAAPKAQRKSARAAPKAQRKSASAAPKAQRKSASAAPKAQRKSASAGASSNNRTSHSRKPDNYPRGAMSAYIMFSNDNRQRIQQAHPNEPITQISKYIAQEWSRISPAAKEQYQRNAEADKARHTREMAAYKAKGGEVFRRSKRNARRAKDPNMPKRALSAYMYFAQDFRASHSNISMLDQMRQAGAAWKNMSPNDKKAYETRAAKDSERYQREIRAYRPAQN